MKTYSIVIWLYIIVISDFTLSHRKYFDKDKAKKCGDEKVSPSSTANLPIALPQQPSCHPVGKDLRGGGGEKLKKKTYERTQTKTNIWTKEKMTRQPKAKINLT